MANGGIGNKCMILVCILIVIILLCENGKLNMENLEGACDDLDPKPISKVTR